MSEDELLEVETSRSRTDAAAALRAIAAGLADGDLSLAGPDGTVTLSPPEDVTLELEVEQDDDELELEIEVGWAGDATAAGADDGTDAEEPADAPDEQPPADDAETAIDPTSVDPSRATFELYQDRAAEWRWRLVHDNGNVIADSGEGYGKRANAEKGLRSVKLNAPGADVERLE